MFVISLFTRIGSIDPPPYPTPQTGCKDGEVIDGRCYQAIDKKFIWQKAQWECELLGSDLAEISNEVLMNKIMTYLPQNKRYWIGLRLNETTYQYEWRSGKTFNESFATWDSVMPNDNNNNDTTKGCTVFKNGKWELKQCDNPYRYLCQNGKLQFFYL